MVKFSEATDSMQLTRKHDLPLGSGSVKPNRAIRIKVSIPIKKNPTIRIDPNSSKRASLSMTKSKREKRETSPLISCAMLKMKSFQSRQSLFLSFFFFFN